MDANELESRLLDFGVRCTYLCRSLPTDRFYDAKHVANQLIRSSTHAGFHYPEARAAESRKDFIHKIKVLLKELRESKSELMYIQCMDYFDDESRVSPLIEEASELVAIFTATVKKLDRQ